MTIEAIKHKFLNGLKQEFKNYYLPYKGQHIVIFGAGTYGKWMYEWFENIGMADSVVAFCDNNSSLWGTRIKGVLCDNIDQIKEKFQKIHVIICSTWEEEITAQLNEKGIIPHKRTDWMRWVENQIGYYVIQSSLSILNVWNWFEYYDDAKNELDDMEKKLLALLDDEESKIIAQSRIQFCTTGDLDCIKDLPYHTQMYFNAVFPVNKNEVLVDCGAYTGDSIDMFLDATQGNYSAIYAFEPDPKVYDQLCTYVENKGLQNVYLHNIALSDEDGDVLFDSNGTMGSFISENGNIVVPAKRLDDMIDRSISIIKMDIEGAELAALQGAEKLIYEYKPNMTICVYHNWDDIFTIPQYIKSLGLGYQFKLRHHANAFYDAVLYAYIER